MPFVMLAMSISELRKPLKKRVSPIIIQVYHMTQRKRKEYPPRARFSERIAKKSGSRSESIQQSGVKNTAEDMDDVTSPAVKATKQAQIPVPTEKSKREGKQKVESKLPREEETSEMLEEKQRLLAEQKEREILFQYIKSIDPATIEPIGDFFLHRTGSWYDPSKWSTMPKIKDIFAGRPEVGDVLERSRALECIPVTEPKDLLLLRRVPYTTSLGSGTVDAYTSMVLACISQYYSKYPPPGDDFETFSMLHSIARYFREIPGAKLTGRAIDVYNALYKTGILYHFTYLFECMVSGDKMTVENLKDVMHPDEVTDLIKSLELSYPELLSLFYLLGRLRIDGIKLIDSVPLVFYHNASLYYYINSIYTFDKGYKNFTPCLPPLEPENLRVKATIEYSTFLNDGDKSGKGDASADSGTKDKEEEQPAKLAQFEFGPSGTTRQPAETKLNIETGSVEVESWHSEDQTENENNPSTEGSDSRDIIQRVSHDSGEEFASVIRKLYDRLDKQEDTIEILKKGMEKLIEEKLENQNRHSAIMAKLASLDNCLTTALAQKGFANFTSEQRVNRTIFSNQPVVRAPSPVLEGTEGSGQTSKKRKIASKEYSRPPVSQSSTRHNRPLTEPNYPEVITLLEATHLTEEQLTVLQSKLSELFVLHNHPAVSWFTKETLGAQETRERAKKILLRLKGGKLA